MRQGYCYTCLAIGGVFRSGHQACEETERWFCKRVVLANVPSFGFWGSRNIRKSLLSSGREALKGKTFSRKFRYTGTSAKTALLKTALFSLSGPISRDIAILSLRCPILRDTFSGRLAAPQNGAISPSVVSFTRAHLRGTPFCNISRDNCAIPHTSKHAGVLRCYRYKYRAM